MRNTLIASLLAGAVFATPAIAQDDGMASKPAGETPVPPVEEPMTADPASEPMTDPMDDPLSDPASEPVPDTAPDAEVVAEIDAMAEGDLTPDQQAQYDAWPTETQTYYTGLTPDRQELFWLLQDNDKVALSQLPEAQQSAAWDMIEEQAQGAPAPQPMDQPTE